MEHRVGIRYPVNLPAAVDHPRLGTLNGRIVDASSSGLYIELPDLHERRVPAVTLWFTPIKLRFRLPGGKRAPIREWRGFVTRAEKDGLAATNASSDAGDRADLIALLEHARRRSHPSSLAAA